MSERMRNESRRRIVSAATHVFARDGYHGCRVSDIAREAGMSQGNVYWHFPTKEDILKTILEEGFEALGTLLEEARQAAVTGRSRLEALVDALIELYRRKGETFTVCASLLTYGGVAALTSLDLDTADIGRGYHHRLRAVLDLARQEGAPKPAEDTDPDVLCGLFFALFNGLVLTYGATWPDLLSTREVAQGALRLLGVAP